MTLEEQVHAALQGLAGGKVFPDLAPAGTLPPYIVYQAVGGAPINFVGGEAPGKENTIVQVSAWAATRIAASALGKQIEGTLRAQAALQAEVASGRAATYDDATGYRGTTQDFSFFA